MNSNYKVLKPITTGVALFINNNKTHFKRRATNFHKLKPANNEILYPHNKSTITKYNQSTDSKLLATKASSCWTNTSSSCLLFSSYSLCWNGLPQNMSDTITLNHLCRIVHTPTATKLALSRCGLLLFISNVILFCWLYYLIYQTLDGRGSYNVLLSTSYINFFNCISFSPYFSGSLSSIRLCCDQLRTNCFLLLVTFDILALWH